TASWADSRICRTARFARRISIGRGPQPGAFWREQYRREPTLSTCRRACFFQRPARGCAGLLRSLPMGARTCLGALIGLACALAPPLARGQDAAPSAPTVEPPPAPSSREGELLAHVHLGSVVPLERSDICPGESICVLGAGAVVGVQIERRWPFGLGVSVAYDAWFVASGGVFELGTAQIMRAVLAYTFAQEWSVHPTLHLGAGALIFGDTFLVSTVGGAIDLGVTVE